MRYTTQALQPVHSSSAKLDISGEEIDETHNSNDPDKTSTIPAQKDPASDDRLPTLTNEEKRRYKQDEKCRRCGNIGRVPTDPTCPQRPTKAFGEYEDLSESPRPVRVNIPRETVKQKIAKDKLLNMKNVPKAVPRVNSVFGASDDQRN